MLKPKFYRPNHASSLFFSSDSLLPQREAFSSLTVQPRTVRLRGTGRNINQIRCAVTGVQTLVADNEAVVRVRAVVTIKLPTVCDLLTNLHFTNAPNNLTGLYSSTLLLELVSAQLDSKTGLEKEPVPAFARWVGLDGNEAKCESNFVVSQGFGDIGGVLVTNEDHMELFIKDIILLTGSSPLTITCNSWVHPKSDSLYKRIFFTDKSYLPAQTPGGLHKLRNKDLEAKQGNGEGERMAYERIYDYDTYNDLGDPDKSVELKRPVLGSSKEHPYPRRCRTGRPKTKTDPLSERSSLFIYVPRDEAFSDVKLKQFAKETFKSFFHALVPSLESEIIDTKLGFPHFIAIDKLFDEGFTLPRKEGVAGFLKDAIAETITDGLTHNVLHFTTPAIIERDKFSWFRDEEFARQTLAGVNPNVIQLVTELPLKSKLDPEVYGPPESAISREMIEQEIKGVMTAEEAVQQKRLFVLDYHDLLLPFVHRVRELEGTTLYGSRTIFFLTNDGTLRPVAIELTRPASPTKPQWKQVFRPSWEATGAWLWKLAKAHVCAHDSCYHELISHWLRTHCCTEPYIIAANRQLSEMHPVYRLLHPHFRYTMEINALALQHLICAGGIIESSFSPLEFSMEICSAAYDELWRFDTEALPADLVRRGMAVEDRMAEHGLRLTINDYPFANDGLLIWSAIKEWVQDYVSHYYPDSSDVLDDYELQDWWEEVRTKGHADKKDEPWWPAMDTKESLISVLTTIIWVASGHHAAVNFGQYHYGGYFPNRPTTARTNMPVEDAETKEEEFSKFLRKPEAALPECFPSQIQATSIMATLDVLSSHSPDEEYLGGEPESPGREDDAVIKAAYERFRGRLKKVDRIIDERNADPNLKNRHGAGVPPYELLKPFSGPGVTGMGIPNSISI